MLLVTLFSSFLLDTTYGLQCFVCKYFLHRDIKCFNLFFSSSLGGHADNSIKLISSDGAKTIETAVGHCAPVTCLALSKDSNYLVTGSRDATIILWRIHLIVSSQLNDIPNSSLPAKSSATSITGGGIINNSSDNNLRRHIEGPMHVLRGHLGEIVCCCVSSDLGIIVSSSYISGVLLHSLRRGRFIRKIGTKDAQAICLSPQGVIMTWNKDEQKLCTFTVNGIPITIASLQSFSGKITCMEVSDDGENVLIGTGHNVTNNEEKEIVSEISKSEVGNESMDIVPNESFVSSNQMSLHVPSICFINMHSLKVLNIFCAILILNWLCKHLGVSSLNLFMQTDMFCSFFG